MRSPSLFLMTLGVIFLVMLSLLIVPTAQAEDSAPVAAPADKHDASALIEQAVSLSLEKLADGDVRGFTVAYLAAVKSYAQFAQQLHDQAHASGAIAADLKWSEVELQRLQAAPAAAASPIPARLISLRAELLTDVQALRREHQAGSAAQRPVVAESLELQVARLELLDQSLAGWSDHRKVDSRLPTEGLAQRIKLLQRQLERDQQFQELQAAILTEALNQTQTDLGRALELMLIQQRLPDNLLDQLKATTAQMRQTLTQLAAARTMAFKVARQELTQGNPMPDAGKLLERVDRLIGPATPSEVPVTVRRRCRP